MAKPGTIEVPVTIAWGALVSLIAFGLSIAWGIVWWGGHVDEKVLQFAQQQVTQDHRITVHDGQLIGIDRRVTRLETCAELKPGSNCGGTPRTAAVTR